MVLGVMETEDDGVAPTNWFAQFKNEEPGGIRLDIRHCEISRGNLHACDRLLFSGIGILNQYRSLKRNCFLFLPADQCQTGNRKECCDQQAAKGFNFVSARHANRSNGVYMMTCGRGYLQRRKLQLHPWNRFRKNETYSYFPLLRRL